MTTMNRMNGRAQRTRRTRRLLIRLRDWELTTLVDAAAKRGMFVAQFVRQAGLAAAQAQENAMTAGQ